MTHEYVCDCGRTKVVVEEPAEYPYGDARQVQCAVCGTYVKEYPTLDREGLGGMNRPFGKLMDLLEAEPRDEGLTLGALAEKYDEPIERIMDALDACKERRGELSYLESAEDWARS